MSLLPLGSSRLHVVIPSVLMLALSACIVFRTVEPQPIEAASSDTVSAPTRAHLLDGSTVLFPGGFVRDGGQLRGSGTRYDLMLAPRESVTVLSLDSIAGVEVVTSGVNTGATVVMGVFTTAALAFGTAVLALAIFGSCPTVYADSAGTAVLEAESFSYSIAPLFEARDVDRLRVAPDGDGVVRLEIRNEALETHYINSLSLIEVRHRAEELVLPDTRGAPVVTGPAVAAVTASDRAGRRLEQALAGPDGIAVGSDTTVVNAAVVTDLEDHLELAFAAPPAGDSTALVLRLRNSLLNTVLFYDIMLSDRGAPALDWIHADLSRIAPALELGQWYTNRMGMRVEVESGGEWHEAARIRDVGPIAWKDVAVMLPLDGTDLLRVRLSYVADNWRIDRVALAARARRPAPTIHTLARIVGPDGRSDTLARAAALAPDGEYVRTWAGHRFNAEWDVGSVGPEEARTFLLASQGYYIEWMRPGWLRDPPATTAFEPSDGVILDALRRWRVARPEMEARFMASRLPVR